VSGIDAEQLSFGEVEGRPLYSIERELG